jgi:SAM-dependent methyltransferase
MTEGDHLAELRIALDPDSPGRIQPPSVPVSQRVLDIGCGAGQTLIAGYPDRVAFGIDVDWNAVRLGRSLTDRVRFTCGRAESLPFQSGTFDLVIARVSLPYTDIAASVKEIRRVLRTGGQLWITLHPFQLCWDQAKAPGWKGKIFFSYILLNSALFHCFQKQIRFRGRYETFQTERGIRKSLEQNQFTSVAIECGRFFLVTARAN